MWPHVMNFGEKGPYLHTLDLSTAEASQGDRTWNSGRPVSSQGDVGAAGGWAVPAQEGYGHLPGGHGHSEHVSSDAFLF